MTTQDLLLSITQLLARVASMEPPSPEVDIYEAGLASTDALTLLIELEDTFGISVPDDRFIEARTPTALAALVASLQEGAG